MSSMDRPGFNKRPSSSSSGPRPYSAIEVDAMPLIPAGLVDPGFNHDVPGAWQPISQSTALALQWLNDAHQAKDGGGFFAYDDRAIWWLRRPRCGKANGGADV